jgi:hypothetical protein
MDDPRSADGVLAMRPYLSALALAACSHPADQPPRSRPPTSEVQDSGVDDDPSQPPGPSEIVLQGELIDMAPPTDPWLVGVLGGTPYLTDSAISFGVYVTRATSPAALEQGLVADLPAVYFYTAANEEGPLLPGPAVGLYSLPSELYGGWYVEQTRLDVESGKVAGWQGAAQLLQPTFAIVYVPRSAPLGQPLVLDFADQGFTSAVATVVDATGTVTWTNDPGSVTEMYKENALSVSSVEIPADAFPAAGDYAVGLAACARTFDSDLEGLERDLTALRAGRMQFWRIEIDE